MTLTPEDADRLREMATDWRACACYLEDLLQSENHGYKPAILQQRFEAAHDWADWCERKADGAGR